MPHLQEMANDSSQPSESSSTYLRPEAFLSKPIARIDLKRLLVDKDGEATKLLKTTLDDIDVRLTNIANKTRNITFNIGDLAKTPQEKEVLRLKLRDLLQENFPEKNRLRGRALFVNPANEDEMVLMSYQLFRRTKVVSQKKEGVAGFANAVHQFLKDESLESLNQLYFHALGRSMQKYVRDNTALMDEYGIDKEKITQAFSIMKKMAAEGKSGDDCYKAFLSADLLMQQGKLVAPLEPMQDFWKYALNAGIPMGKPTIAAGRTPTFSSVISVPGYNAVEHLHPAYGAQMTARMDEFFASVKKTHKASKSEGRPTVIDAGPCTGTILVPTAEKFPDIDFVAVEPDEPSCKILRQACLERGITNIKILQKCAQDVTVEDLEGKKIHGLYSSFAAHHMPLGQVLSNINQISHPQVQIMITDEWTAPLGKDDHLIGYELMQYHLPIVLERCKLMFKVDFDELLKTEGVTQEQVNLIKDFNRDAHILFDLVCNNQHQASEELLEQMKSYNERYADIFEKKAVEQDFKPLNPTVAILLFGIQEFGALHQGAKHYREEHKSHEKDFTEMAIRDYGLKPVNDQKPTLRVMGVQPKGREDGSGILATRLVGESHARIRY